MGGIFFSRFLTVRNMCWLHLCAQYPCPIELDRAPMPAGSGCRCTPGQHAHDRSVDTARNTPIHQYANKPIQSYSTQYPIVHYSVIQASWKRTWRFWCTRPCASHGQVCKILKPENGTAEMQNAHGSMCKYVPVRTVRVRSGTTVRHGNASMARYTPYSTYQLRYICTKYVVHQYKRRWAIIAPAAHQSNKTTEQ